MRRKMRFLWPVLAAVCGCGWMLIQLLGGHELYLHLGGLNSRRAAGALLFLCLVFLLIWADMALCRSIQTRGGRIGLCFVLLGGWTNFYEPVCPGLMRKLDASLGTDDGYRPFSAGMYQLTWETDRLLVDYDFGSGGIWKTCRVPLG